MEKYQIIINDNKIKDSTKSNVDGLYLMYITFNDIEYFDNINHIYNKNDIINIIISKKNFNEGYNDVYSVIIYDINIIALEHETKSIMFNFTNYDYISNSKIRKDKIQKILNL